MDLYTQLVRCGSPDTVVVPLRPEADEPASLGVTPRAQLARWPSQSHRRTSWRGGGGRSLRWWSENSTRERAMWWTTTIGRMTGGTTAARLLLAWI